MGSENQMPNATLEVDRESKPVGTKEPAPRWKRLSRFVPREKSTAFGIVATVAVVVQAFLVFMFLFEPGLPYVVPETPSVSLQSDEFLRLLENISNSRVRPLNSVEVLTNGEAFYEAELAAIRAARQSINMEAYIFSEGKVTRQFLDALVERARAGVRVKLVVDAIGSFTTPDSYFKQLRDEGGQVVWYHPVHWHTVNRFNNRTHRELLVVDGRIGFVGGAGFADHWLHNDGSTPRWRDTMFRLEGTAVAGLQSTFVENWLEASGEILSDADYFPALEIRGQSSVMVVDSSPSAGRSTRARALFQILLASARKTIHVTTPYFLPDETMRGEILRAVRERGVEVKIITPGKQSDHRVTRSSSRRLYGDLLRGGASIYEYGGTMIHTKSLVIDGRWCVVGSTNMDSRSFGLNDEVNLAVMDAKVAARLLEDFDRDLSQSRAISYDEWRRRPIIERFEELFGWVIERQQ
jgi:cardiolipin synthase A/B